MSKILGSDGKPVVRGRRERRVIRSHWMGPTPDFVIEMRVRAEELKARLSRARKPNVVARRG